MMKPTALALSALMAATAAWAQEPSTGTVRGTVFDSTSMAPLSGARVAVMGTPVMVEADGEGRYELEEVPEGTYPVTFFHPRLQELGISAGSVPVSVEGGESYEVLLAIPSESTLLRAWCAAEVQGPGLTPIAGHVADSLTGVKLPRASVTISVFDGAGRITQTYTARTNEEGYYRACNVPGGSRVQLVATFGRNASAPERFSLPSDGAMTRDLEMVLSSIGEIRGTVRDYATKEPLAGARVTVAGEEVEALTDEEGAFLITDLPPGLHLVETEYIGYAERVDSVTIFSDEAVLVEVPLSREAIVIEGMTVTARARVGDPLTDIGRRTDFIGRPEVDALLPRVRNMGDLIQGANFPGLMVREVRIADGGMQLPGFCVEHNRARRRGGTGCAMVTVFVDNLRLPDPSIYLSDLDPNIVQSIQLLGPTEAALRYGTQGVNGVVLITTRRGGGS